MLQINVVNSFASDENELIGEQIDSEVAATIAAIFVSLSYDEQFDEGWTNKTIVSDIIPIYYTDNVLGSVDMR